MKLDDIALLAGVSRTTASYVINGKAKQYRVSEKTVSRVMAVVREHNYLPNVTAASLRAGRTRLIGLVIPDLENSSFTRIASYLERGMRCQGYQLIIVCSEDKAENEIACIEHLLQRKVEGIIVATALSPTDPFYQHRSKQHPPIIAFDRALDPHLFASVVGSDQQDAYLLAIALRKLAVSSVLYFGAAAELPVSIQREQGFYKAWQHDSRAVDYLYCAKYARETAATTLHRYLAHHPLPEALFTTSLQLLQGALDELRRFKDKVANTMVIATFGDDALLDFLPYPILTVAQRHQEIAEHLLHRMLAAVKHAVTPPPGLTTVRRHLRQRGWI